MEDQIDHYIVLGLPSGEEGSKLSEKEITKAYRKKALELHPDKRPDDDNAHADIQKLNASYAILKDEKARQSFDDFLRVKLEKVRRESQQDSKRRKLRTDLEEREQAAFAPDPEVKAREEEDRIRRKFKEEVARVRAEYAKKVAPATQTQRKEETTAKMQNVDGNGSASDKEKMLKVSWEKIGEDYSAEKLKELFEKFGEVEDVIKSSKKKRTALVLMASKDAVVAATGSVVGNLTNPLRILPVQPAGTTNSPNAQGGIRTEDPELSNFAGIGYSAFENTVLKKLQKAAEKQK